MQTVKAGGFHFRDYTREYVTAADLLLAVDIGGDAVDAVALPTFFLLRHAMELAMKDVLEAIADNRRDDEALSVFRREFERLSALFHSLELTPDAARVEAARTLAVEKAQQVFANTLEQFSKCPKMLQSHNLDDLMRGFEAEQLSTTPNINRAVRIVQEFERNQVDRSRYPTGKDRTKSSLPGILEQPVELRLAELANCVRLAVDELVGNNDDSMAKDLWHESRERLQQMMEFGIVST